MGSYAILRTNVGLTTNVKIMVGGTYSLYMDSIISNPDLAQSKYRKVEFNKDNYIDELIPYFFKNTPSDIAYHIKDDNDNDNMSTKFSKQYDDIYQYGARNITANKDYIEEYEYFAPIYINKNKMPSNFIIFRIDGPGLEILNKDNFHSNIINNLKCIKSFDLTRKTPLGEWIDKNITKNKSFPISPFYMDFRRLEFSTWIGIDYEDGGYSEKSVMLDSTIEYEQTFHDMEKFIFNGYKNNKVVFPHILNFSFLFDDTPATPSSLRKWSLNRYLGFYLNSLDLVKYVSPYILPKIKDDVIIDSNNILYSISSMDPFVESWKKEDYPYIEIGGDFYKIEKYIEKQNAIMNKVKISSTSYEDRPIQSDIQKYKIISNLNLQGRQSEINKNLIYIDSTNGKNKLTFYDNNTFDIDGYDMADVWLIEIDGKYHNINREDDGEFYIKTDYAFAQSIEKLDYYINDPDPNYRTSISLKVDNNTPPKKFGIYKCNFSDIKDFDYDIIDTKFSKHEYINKNSLTITDENKLYTTNQDSNSNPKNFNDYKINGDVVHIPTSSEYTANSETFRIVDNKLSTLWKKNHQRVKWGYQNSISSNDYPYLLNNSFISDDFNRTANPFNPNPERVERNLDHLLTINAESNEFLHHSVHIVDDEIITFNGSGDYNGFIYFTNISNIGAFCVGDIVKIQQDSGFTNPSYNTTTFVTSVEYINNIPCVIVNLSYTTPSVSGIIENLSRTTFNIDRYLGINYNMDYFSYFFGHRTYFDSGNELVNTKKWSIFNTGDKSLPNDTLFRGLKFNIYDVDGVKITNGKVDSINIKTSNSYDGYKFAILASTNNYSVNPVFGDMNIATVSFTNNGMKWVMIDNWRHDKLYKKDSLVVLNDIIYKCLSDSNISDPHIYPYNSTDWTTYNDPSIFWSPSIDGSGQTASKNNIFDFSGKFLDQITGLPSKWPALVYNSGEYYYSSGQSGNNFWTPGNTYSINDIVLFGKKTWRSTISSNTSIPGENKFNIVDGSYVTHWVEDINATTIWNPVELWKDDVIYNRNNSTWNQLLFSPGHYVIYNDEVWVTVGTSIKGIPPSSPNWTKVYSLVMDTKFPYNYKNNNIELFDYNKIIYMNNRLYLCVDNKNASTLENGINIFVNKKYKNILVNIYVNDNSYSIVEDAEYNTWVTSKDLLSKTNRDEIYSDIFSKLTANNIMNAINDLENKHGFSDNIRYIVINEDSTINIYDFNTLSSVKSLPVLLTCHAPDEFLTRIQSNIVSPVNLSVSEIKSNRKLDNGNISSIDQLNYYSDIHLATTIKRRTDDPMIVQNFSGMKNEIYNTMYRHSGNYSPIFNEIELFRSPGLTNSYNNGNYKFDTDLTHFGKIKERLVSKVNRYKNILKLKNNPNNKSIYPMLDEYGYHPIDFLIFKSTWDYEYHVECNEVSQIPPVIINQSIVNKKK